MESLPPTLPPEREKIKSFDMMASIDMMQFDYQRFGYVLPETRKRIYDEELSSLAEAVDRAACTSFTLPRQNGDLMYFDSGTLRPYLGMLTTGLETARREKEEDPRKTFLYDWAVRDLQYGYRMDGMQPGEKLAWFNAYPKDMEQAHGKEFLRSLGLSPDRELGFFYIATCNEDGSVTLDTQTVDHSDQDAFDAAMQQSSHDALFDMDTLVRAYDGVLSKKHGGRFYAGRRNSEKGENAWEELLLHEDLICFYLDGLEQLAASNMPRIELERATKRHIIGSWKAFKNRLDGKTPPPLTPANPNQLLNYDAAVHRMRLLQETQSAYRQAARDGDIKTSCGGSLRPDEDPLDSLDGRGTFDSIFGDKSSKEESYKFDKNMYCVVCQSPPKSGESKKMCGPCGICKGCDTRIRTKAKGALALAA